MSPEWEGDRLWLNGSLTIHTIKLARFLLRCAYLARVLILARQVDRDAGGFARTVTGKEEDVASQRIQNCLREIRKRAGTPTTITLL